MAKLIQGYTNLLNPVNLLPNADFSRGGGIPNPINYTQSAYIDENKTIYSQRGLWQDNGSQRLGGGEFRLKGWLRRNGTTSGSVYIIIRQGNGATFLGNNGIPFTVAFKVKNNMPSDGSVKLRANASVSGASASLTIYYTDQHFITSEYTEYVSIYFSTSPMQVMYCIVPENSQTLGNDPVYIDVTIKDLRCFEGAYINPPLGKSLDTSAAPLFITHNMGDEVTDDMRAGFPIQRIREFITPVNTNGLTTIKVLLSSKTIGSDGYEHIFVAYLYEVLGSYKESSVFKKHLIKFLARNVSNTASIRHKTITLLDDYTMRYPTGATYDRYLITWDLDSSYVNSLKGCGCILTGVATQLPPNTKFFIQPIVIEDSGNYNSMYPWYKSSAWIEKFS